MAGSTEPSEVSEIDIVREAMEEEYEIIRELGRGGMAIVFQARETHLERDVALKVLPFSLSFDKEFVERFQREARTSARLEHPNIIPIYRVGKSGRVIYFVMKFLRGSSLSDVIEKEGRLPAEEIRKLLVQASGALGYAHKRGIVHRDIKPDNIMFDELGNAIVTDFGIAKAATGTRLTGTGMAIGTPHYMSPEQARAQNLDGRSDLYSLGVLAYQALAGHVPFDGEDAFSIGYKHIMEPVPPPPLRSPEERELFEIIRRMMAKSPDDRFQTAEDLTSALEGEAPPVRAPRASVADLPTTILPTADKLVSMTAGQPGVARPSTPTTPIPKAKPAPDQEEAPKKRSGVLVGALFFLMLSGGGAGAVWYFGMGATWPPEWPPDFSRGGETVVVPPSQLGDDSAATGIALGDSLGLGDVGSDSAGRADLGLGGPADLAANGWVVIRDMPTLAKLTINGQAYSADSVELAPGSKRIEITKTSFEPYDTSVVVGRGETVEVRVGELKRSSPAPQPRPVTPPRPRRDFCSEPGSNYNSDGSCFDSAPAPTRPCLLDRPDGAGQRVTGTVWIKIAADGTVATQQQVATDNLRFRLAVRRFLSETQFRPAQKGGRAVDAWLLLSCVSR